MTSIPGPPGQPRQTSAIRGGARIVVVGAGIAGLTAAQQLHPSFEVIVVDKSRGVGGRLATRRIGDASLDHGAQFITTHTPEFAATVATWSSQGVARAWFDGRIGPGGIVDHDGHTRHRGVTTMNAIAKHLAIGLDVRLASPVEALEPSAGTWQVRVEGGDRLPADAVLLTAPVPQSMALLAAGGIDLAEADRQALDAIDYDPCTAVLAVLDGPSGLEPPGAVRPDVGPIEWMADNHLKGVSATPAVTIHATAEFSRAHAHDSDEQVVDEMLAAATLRARPIEGQTQVQRWRFARPTALHPERHLTARAVPPLVFAGDAFGGAHVEGAALSGVAGARAVAETVARR